MRKTVLENIGDSNEGGSNIAVIDNTQGYDGSRGPKLPSFRAKTDHVSGPGSGGW